MRGGARRMDSEMISRTSLASSLTRGSVRATVVYPKFEKRNMEKNLSYLKRERRGSDGVCASLATLDAKPSKESKGRKRGRRGGLKKRRGGKRKDQKKVDRLRLKNINVGYWNCRSAKQRGGELERLCYDFDILLLQETQADRDINCPGYKCYTNPASKTHHGQAIMVREDLNHQIMDMGEWNREDREVQAVKVEANGRKWIVVNTYIGGATIVKEENWNFLSDFEALGDTVLVLGDYNARSHSWGNVNENEQGKALDSALLGMNLSLLNSNIMTRLAQRESEEDSNIDLALITAGQEIFTQWSVLPSHGSDHLPCSVLIAKGKVKHGAGKKKRVFRYKETDSVLSGIRKKAWARKAEPSKFTKPPWWNEDTQAAWESKNRSTKEWHRAKKRKDIDERERKEKRQVMADEREKFKNAASLAKKKKWEDFAENVAADKALEKFWRLHRQMNGRRKGTVTRNIKDANGRTLVEDSDKGLAFLKRFLEQSDQGDIDNRKEAKSLAEAACPDCEHPDPLTVDEIRSALRKSKDGASGPDGVRYSHLKDLSENELERMSVEMNESIQTGKIPEEWLHSFLAPIPKPGKDHSALNGYRVITMQNVYGKVLEKAIARRISRELEDRKLLPGGLGSYRQGRDTTINAAVMAYEIYEGFQEKEETIIAAIDLEDAYNRVDYGGMIHKMVDMDLDPFLVRWIAGALFSRKVALRCGTWTSEPRETLPGLPQGSPLSPVLFNIYTAELAKVCDKETGRTLTFADDVTAYELGHDRNKTARNLQQRLGDIEQWCYVNNAVTNPDKAQVLWCSLDNRIVNDPTPPITMNCEVIERRQELKYLGVTFDRSLSFGRHIDNTISKAKKGIGAVKTMANALMPQRILFLMMQLVVLSVLDYGLGLLTLSKSQVERLERVQNEAMRAVLGCTRDTTIACMRHILGIPSIAVRHKLAQAKMYLKVMEVEDHPLKPALRQCKGSRLKRGQSWIAQAEDSIKKVCPLDEINEGNEAPGLTKVAIAVKKS